MTFAMTSGGITEGGKKGGLTIRWSQISAIQTTPSGFMSVSFVPSSGLSGEALLEAGYEETLRQLRLDGYRAEQSKIGGDQVIIAIMGEEHLP